MIVTPEIFAKLSQQGFAAIDLGARTKKALLGSLTEEELDLFALLRSRAWCGTNWEEQEKGCVELILMARTPAKKPLLKKIFPFL
jgi:hypothetical protein